MVALRTAVITGASGGIGAATARAIARRGMQLVLVDIGAPPEPILEECDRLGAARIIVMEGDLREAGFAAAIIRDAKAQCGQVDVLVNIAGAMIFRRIADMTEQDWFAMLGINFLSAAMLVGSGLREMEHGGSIVNVASIHARQTTSNVAGYAAAKAALVSLTRSAAIEGRESGIRVNSVLPGAIDTPMLWSNPMVKSGAEKIEPSDVGNPDDVAAAIDFFASRESEFITGSELLVDGGRLARL